MPTSPENTKRSRWGGFWTMSDWTPGEALFFAVLFSVGAVLMVWSATDSTGWHRATDLAAAGFMSVSVGLALRQVVRARTSGDDDDDVA